MIDWEPRREIGPKQSSGQLIAVQRWLYWKDPASDRDILVIQRTGLSAMAWALLGIAGILEIAFAYWMKSSEGFTRLVPALLTVVTGLSSVFLLSLSLRTLPVGTGYAVWTGIGAAGTAILGMAVLGDSVAPMRVLSIGFILTGVIGLRLVSGN
jgi:quaternary ammonium compound-resistance protein SugE